MKLALRIEASTYRGTLHGVPRLVDLLKRHEARASFFFTLGRDRTGKLLRHADRSRDVPRELSRRARYGRRAQFYGTLLPAPDIGRGARTVLQSVRKNGFEVGIRAYDEVEWLRCMQRSDEGATRHALERAIARFREIFSGAPLIHAAPDWQSSPQALRLEQRLGFAFASDTRGSHPFMPVQNGELVLCPQLPTTLPTADELLRQRRATGETLARALLDQTPTESERDQVYSLHAELEGGALAPAFEAALEGWKRLGYQVCALGELLDGVDVDQLPRHELTVDNVPGRRDAVLMQGAEFLGEWARQDPLLEYRGQ